MNVTELYHFLFETPTGVGILVFAVIVICIVVSALLELRTRRLFVDRTGTDDDWSFFDDNEDETKNNS